jgi:ammonia channel protein AmtB
MGAHLGGAPADPDSVDGATTMPWSRLNGVRWAVFLLFSWTTASIISGALIERVRSSAF